MSLPYAKQPAFEEPRVFGSCCRVTNALKVVAVIEMIWLCFNIGACVFSLTSGRYSSIFGLLFGILGLVATGKLWGAVDPLWGDFDPQSVNFYLGWKYTQMVFAIIAAGLLINVLTLLDEDDDYYYLSIILVVYMGVLLVSGVVFLAIAHKAKQYLTQKSETMANEVIVPLPPMQATIQGQPPPPYAHY